MGINIEKDSTKSIAWLALDKETQEKLVDAELQHLTSTNKTPSRNDSYEHYLVWQIHSALGVKKGDYKYLNSDLKKMLIDCKGGIYDEIENYLKKFEEILMAVRTEAARRKSQEIKPTGPFLF